MQIPSEFAPGQLLSELDLKQFLKRSGHHVKVYRGARLIPPERIAIGDYSQIDEGVRIFAGGGVEICRHVHFAFGTSISGGGMTFIGDFVGVGTGTRIITGSEIFNEGGLTNPTIPPQFRSVSRGRVEIQPHALIFTNVVILPNVTVGEGAVVGACSLVHRDLKPWGVYAGNPLVQIGTRDPEPVLEKASQLLSSEKSDLAPTLHK
jgi:acetyltransferase-like isoleucine patch superfamily enzyme